MTTAADGKTEIYQSCNRPLMVKAVDFNRLYGELVGKEALLNEMGEALEEIVRCLSHGLQDCRASVTAKAMLKKYHEQVDKQ